MKNKKKHKNRNKRIKKATTTVVTLPPKMQESKLKNSLRKLKLFFVNIYSFLVFVLGISGMGIYTFYPRILIDVSELMNPYKPFYYPFVVRNNGNIKVKNFSYIIKSNKIVFDNGTYFNGEISGDINNTIPIIKIDGSNPIDLTNLINTPEQFLKEAEIFIKYSYVIPLINITFLDSTKFRLMKDRDDKYRWLEYQ